MGEIISVIAVVLIVLAICKVGIELLLNIICHPTVLCLIGIGVTIWGIIMLSYLSKR